MHCLSSEAHNHTNVYLDDFPISGLIIFYGKLPYIGRLLRHGAQESLPSVTIYNADETGLYWKLLPEKTYVSSLEKTAPGRKTEKQTLTFLTCTNSISNHKLNPLVIGKAKKPRSFRNFNYPVHYNSSKSAWMTAPIFKPWFHKMFIPEVKKFMRKNNLPVNAMLLLDNAPSHPPAEELRSDDGCIFAMYMPHNVTPLIQPMDQNVIKVTKLFYRKNLLSHIIGQSQDIGTALKSANCKRCCNEDETPENIHVVESKEESDSETIEVDEEIRLSP
ncbi:hypothetical protein NQ314_014789 [Rhamnusium bicolor]|uniref:DDE-1 domain-containing protein n=1 Tax=Rhamnusium bicolor TaxID=1586634 RepID=A0AAV8X133_9CUCU|nr:hypothetical protein NQ314_014789 [Rhamnusium bicolor]